jgi:ACS family hexuronate transporter-like MFS transporter
VIYAPYSKNLWAVVGLVGMATAAHQGWSANVFTMVSDMFPRSAVGSVVGIGSTIGMVGSTLMQIGTGYIVQLAHSYVPMFIMGGCAYLTALAVVQLLSPRLTPAKLG